jgi:protein-disulfide isomerase
MKKKIDFRTANAEIQEDFPSTDKDAAMMPQTLKLLVFTAMLLGVAALLPLPAAAAQPLAKEDVEKIVQDYIMNNPQAILDSVDNYQKKMAQQRQEEGLDRNRDEIFKDAGSPEIGNPKGDITVVEFFDYNCGYCKHVLPDIQALVKKDKNVRFVFKDFPILGPSSETAAKWALAAHKQNKYFDFHRALMENKTPITDELLESIAAKTGMDVAAAKQAVGGPDIAMQIEKNRSLAENLGLTGTPAFIVGNDILRGAFPLAELEKKIAEQRKAKK